MRVAVFFDGKHYYKGWVAAGAPRVDLARLVRWLVGRVGGTSLWAAHYYTGVETRPERGRTGVERGGPEEAPLAGEASEVEPPPGAPVGVEAARAARVAARPFPDLDRGGSDAERLAASAGPAFRSSAEIESDWSAGLVAEEREPGEREPVEGFVAGGFAPGEPFVPGGQARLASFLDRVSLLPGFFVYPLPRRSTEYTCAVCGATNPVSHEKEVDTTIVADLVRLAATDAYATVVVVSGDADHVPGLEAVRAFGKRAYVATWGRASVALRLRRAAFDHIDLTEGLGTFAMRGAAEEANGPTEVGSAEVVDLDAVFLDELRRAEAHFSGAYVGANYFVTKWRSERLGDSPDLRRRILDRLVAEGLVEVYVAPSGERALRVVAGRLDRVRTDGGRTDPS